jgi:hypothetical protein
VVYEAQCLFDPQPREPYWGFKLFNLSLIIQRMKKGYVNLEQRNECHQLPSVFAWYLQYIGERRLI